MTNFLYNPDRKSKGNLIAEFVVRTKLLEDIMQDIESSDMVTPEQHYLLVGQRGTGKTTLLHRIRYAIEDSEKLNKWLIPVIFSEHRRWRACSRSSRGWFGQGPSSRTIAAA